MVNVVTSNGHDDDDDRTADSTKHSKTAVT